MPQSIRTNKKALKIFDEIFNVPKSKQQRNETKYDARKDGLIKPIWGYYIPTFAG